MKKLALLLLACLAACVPTARYYPPDTPIVYSVPYRALFDATLQELTAAYVPDALSRRTFALSQADPETGLITAVRSERGATARIRYQFPEDDDDDFDGYDGFPFGFGFGFAVPVPTSPPERTQITVVVRPQGRGSSIIYSTQSPDGTTSYDAERLMRQVIAKLDARFAAPTPTPAPAAPQPLTPLEPGQ